MYHSVSIILMLATLLFGVSAKGYAQAAPSKTPNIVVMFIDDMGYADIGPFGAEGYQTPHLDQMAKEGMRFTDFQVSSAVCSASRIALLTGCYHVRVGIQGALGPGANHGIHEDEMTLAELCKQKGYATACYGKWHLGHHPKFLPTNHGFDEYFGLPYSNDMWPYHPGVRHLEMADRLKRWPHLPLMRNTEVINPQVDDKAQEQLTKQYAEHAVDFINRNKDKPFFLYVPHSMVHVPLYVSDDFRGKSGAGLFGDVVMEVDWSMGEILKALKTNGIDDNTLVIFTTDNGPWLSYGDHAGSAKPLREGKGTMWEGGCRVPTLMRWPGKIAAGKTCDELSSTIDILPTVAKLIGADLPKHKIDGVDVSSLMLGDESTKSPRESFYHYYSGAQLHAVRDRQWKLHFPHQYRTLAGRDGGTGGIPVRYEQAKTGLELYDLKSDVGETKNVAEQHPEIVKRLQAMAAVARADLGDRLSNTTGSGRREHGRLGPGDARTKLVGQSR